MPLKAYLAYILYGNTHDITTNIHWAIKNWRKFNKNKNLLKIPQLWSLQSLYRENQRTVLIPLFKLIKIIIVPNPCTSCVRLYFPALIRAYAYGISKERMTACYELQVEHLLKVLVGKEVLFIQQQSKELTFRLHNEALTSAFQKLERISRELFDS